MNAMIAYCGSACQECEAFVATRNNDDAKRAEIARVWSERYHAEIKAEDINCAGCKSTGTTRFNYCNICEIRKCAAERGAENCAGCGDYPCEMLNKFFEVAPDNKKMLDAMRA